jgi:hypothetical protein
VIVRKENNGEVILIGQTDHSRLVGQLAYDSVVRAATFHDFGWLRYETNPLLNPETGEPYSFLQVPLTETQLDSYQWSLDWMAGIDSYSGLIVSMHRTGLWKSRYGTIRYPEGYNIRNMSPEVVEFIKRNEAWQERERKSWNTEQVWINYRLMQIWDLLGLYFCCHELCEDFVEPVPLDYSDKEGIRLTLKPAGEGRVRFEPYPFTTRPCHVQLAFRRLPKTTFENIEAFHRAYFQAENELMHFELVDCNG